MGQDCCSGRKKETFVTGKRSEDPILLSTTQGCPHSGEAELYVLHKQDAAVSATKPIQSELSAKRVELVEKKKINSPVHKLPDVSALQKLIIIDKEESESPRHEDESPIWWGYITLLLVSRLEAILLLTHHTVYIIDKDYSTITRIVPIERIELMTATQTRQSIVLHINQSTDAEEVDLCFLITRGEDFFHKLLHTSYTIKGYCLPFRTLESDYMLRSSVNNVPKQVLASHYAPEQLQLCTCLFLQNLHNEDLLFHAKCDFITLNCTSPCLFLLMKLHIHILKPDLQIWFSINVRDIQRIVFAIADKAVGLGYLGKLQFWTLPMISAEMISKTMQKLGGRKLVPERATNIIAASDSRHALSL